MLFCFNNGFCPVYHPYLGKIQTSDFRMAVAARPSALNWVCWNSAPAATNDAAKACLLFEQEIISMTLLVGLI
jgi:hypothetical protein